MSPTFSIIIPTYNRPRQLRRCLAALARLDYPRDRFEVLIVDDGSPTSLQPVVDAFRPAFPVTLHRQANAGPSAARNTGAAVARGRWLAFTDDDCAVDPPWLHAFEAVLSRGQDVLVSGQTINALTRNPYSSTSQLIIDVLYEHFNADHEHADFFPSNNIALPADLYRAVGGFDTRFRCSEDRDLCDRLKARGVRLVYTPAAVMHHAHDLTLAKLWRQHVGYGRGAWSYHQARKHRGTGRLTVEGNFYAKCFARALASRGSRGPQLAALLGVWQLANAAGFFYQAARERFASAAGGCNGLLPRVAHAPH